MVSPCAAWEPFRDLIPENERKCFLEAYHKRLNSDDMETQVRFTFSIIYLVRFYFDMYFYLFQYAAARAWTKWEMMTAHLLPNEENIKKGDDDAFSLVSYLEF